MNTRRNISILMIVTLALFAGACSSNDKEASPKKSDKTETTKAEGDSSTTSTTSKPLSEKEYANQLDEVSKAVAAAGTDTCKLVEALNANPPEPQTKDQVKKMVDTYGQLLNAVAGALPPTSIDSIKALQEAAASLAQKAKEADYSADFFSGEAFNSTMTGNGMTAAFSEFQTAAQKCAPAAGADGSVDTVAPNN